MSSTLWKSLFSTKQSEDGSRKYSIEEMSSTEKDSSSQKDNHPKSTKKDSTTSSSSPSSSESPVGVVSGWERFFSTKQIEDGSRKYSILDLGHKNVVKGVGDEDTPWMDEHAVRIRAGLLHILSWISILNVFYMREPIIAFNVIPLAIWEFLSSSTFGMTPVAPLGTIATAMSMILYKEPLWVPARPKRFAWLLGLAISVSCLVCWRVGWEYGFKQKHEEMMMMHSRRHLTMDMEGMGDDNGGMMNMDDDAHAGCMEMDMNDLSEFPVAAVMLVCIKAFVITCLILTWLEGNCGFCLGCFIYNLCPCTKKDTVESTNKESDNMDNDAHCEVCVY